MALFMRRGNIWIAVLVAPLVQILVLTASFPVFLVFEEATTSSVFRSLIVLAVFAMPIAYIGTIIVGLPVHHYLKKRRMSEPRIYALIGLAFSALVGLLLFFEMLNSPLGWVYIALIAVSGGVVALTFGYLATEPKNSDGAI